MPQQITTVRDPQWGPWLTPLASRIRTLRDSEQSVVYLAEQPNGSTFRYRCYTTAQAINLFDDQFRATWFYDNELDAVRENIRFVRVLVVSRYRWSDRLASLISFARARGVKVAFDCDDLVFDVSLIPTIMRTLDVFTGIPELDEKTYDYWFSYVGRLAATAKLADFSILSTRPLAEAAKHLFGVETFVVPNMVSVEQLKISEQLRRAPRIATKQEIVLGYFSGSPSHNRDFALVVDAVAEVMRRHQQIRLLIVGFLDLPDWFSNEFSERIKLEQLVDSETLLSLIASVDVNLAPLQSNEFTACKSELKFFDAAFLRVPTLCSDTGTIPECTRESKSALFATDSAWLAALEYAIGLGNTEASQLADRALAVAESRFSVLGIDYQNCFGWIS